MYQFHGWYGLSIPTSACPQDFLSPSPLPLFLHLKSLGNCGEELVMGKILEIDNSIDIQITGNIMTYQWYVMIYWHFAYWYLCLNRILSHFSTRYQIIIPEKDAPKNPSKEPSSLSVVKSHPHLNVCSRLRPTIHSPTHGASVGGLPGTFKDHPVGWSLRWHLPHWRTTPARATWTTMMRRLAMVVFWEVGHP